MLMRVRPGGSDVLEYLGDQAGLRAQDLPDHATVDPTDSHAVDPTGRHDELHPAASLERARWAVRVAARLLLIPAVGKAF